MLINQPNRDTLYVYVWSDN